MYVRVSDIDTPGLGASPEAGMKLKELIEPALARGEQVELDFEGLRFFAIGFFVFSIGKLVETDTADRVPALLRYLNLNEAGQSYVKSAVEFAIRRRDNPRWAAGAGAAAEKMAERE